MAMTYDAYDNWEPKNGFKYERKNGFAIKNGDFIKNIERYIILNIQDKFINTESYKNENRSVPETRCKLNERITRIPELAFFTKEQIQFSAQNLHPIPEFVIEIISKNENTFETESKIKEYFDAGVKTVWQIFQN